MPRGRGRTATVKEAEPVKTSEPFESDEPEETVDLDEIEEEMEEEFEYEEVEEIEEVEEEEEEEEEVVEEAEETNEQNSAANGVDTRQYRDSDMKDSEIEDDESEKHAELLALPPHGSEIYVGGLLRDVFEKDLKIFCESVGQVTEVRIMKGKDSSETKGYAFVTYKSKELATKAIKELNNTDLKGKKVRCSTSQAKNRLFIGNIPRNWTDVGLKKVVEKLGPGVNRIDLMKDAQNGHNRGFAFVEYYNHACAEYSRKKMSDPKFKLDSNAPTVSWADPKSGDSSASQVKAVYVKNLPKNVTQDQLRKLFKHHGEITKVVLPPAKSGQENRFGFVHFAERPAAMKALKNTEKYELDGQVLECSLAKPPTEKKVDAAPNTQKGPLLSNYPSQMGYGVMGGTYGALGAGFAQPMLYGRGAVAPGMAMVPMILPDGQLAYVMQQPGAPLATAQNTNSQTRRSSSGRQNNGNNRGRRFHPY